MMDADGSSFIYVVEDDLDGGYAATVRVSVVVGMVADTYVEVRGEMSDGVRVVGTRDVQDGVGVGMGVVFQ